MKKIGIITFYHNTRNYGGALQAYALCRVLRKNGFDAEQISFQEERENKSQARKPSSMLFSMAKRVLKIVLFPQKSMRRSWVKKQNRRTVPAQASAFYAFLHDTIPHSKEVYASETLASCATEYDVFITGSDQVWNPEWFISAYFLDFVPQNRKKIAYAASLGHSSLNEAKKEMFSKYLRRMDAVSVREKEAVDLLRPLVPFEVVHALDPTLLLEREEWEKVCAPRIIDDKYAFCYFLGDNPKERRIAETYAKAKGFRLVAVVCTSNMYIDKGFAAEKLVGVSPSEFLSLIKHAECVFTDSFHAVVFSKIFEKQFFVFNRDAKGSMNGRIFDITDLFNAPERFCYNAERETLAYISSLPDIDYTSGNKKVETMREKSIRFLLENIT